ncbi:MAG: hypothetical protein WA642_04090 [Steroidobacteraceae bacterium]
MGTLVATEGGPGYAATESRDAYLALFKPLRPRRDFLLMDNRGTGPSAAIDCRELQTTATWTTEMIGACGRQLGDSAPLYSTAYAVDDLAAILEALDIPRIALYGDPRSSSQASSTISPPWPMAPRSPPHSSTARKSASSTAST